MENKFNPPQQEPGKSSRKTSKTSKRKSKETKVGEYIDYEEID